MPLTKDWDFALSQDYKYNDDEIIVSSGAAKILGTGGAYGTGNPYLTVRDSVIAEAISSFTETKTSGTGDLVKYILNVDMQDKWWTGSAWGTSNGSYAQSNIFSDIDANISSLISARSRVKFKAFLHSHDGTTTPNLQNINMSYTFSAYCTADDVRGVMVNIDTNNLKDEDIMTYIEAGQNIINMNISMQYDLPITNADALKVLRTMCLIIASYHLSDYLAKREKQEVSKLTKDTYSMVMETLKMIAEGKKSLTGLSLANDMMDISTLGYNATFNEGPVENWEKDSDLLDDIADGSFDG